MSMNVPLQAQNDIAVGACICQEMKHSRWLLRALDAPKQSRYMLHKTMRFGKDERTLRAANE